MGTRTRKAFAAAPRSAAKEKKSLEGITSARFSTDASAVPATKPIWTPVVSHPTWEAERSQRSWSSGPMALAVNQTDIPINSAADRSVRIAHRVFPGACPTPG